MDGSKVAKNQAHPGPAERHGLHRSHKDVVNRLKRADGHLKKIIDMVESQRSCLEIAQQMQAVIKALDGAKSLLIHDHIDHCLEEATGPIGRNARGPLDEFKEITRYL
jgi:DNA-binding FrmR family transcriptional regulator